MGVVIRQNTKEQDTMKRLDDKKTTADLAARRGSGLSTLLEH
jgi:hypothetical protein